MNLARNLIADRKAFAFALFVDHPDLTVAEAYKAVKKKFRLGMDRGRLGKLKARSAKIRKTTKAIKPRVAPATMSLEDQIRQIIREEVREKVQGFIKLLAEETRWEKINE